MSKLVQALGIKEKCEFNELTKNYELVTKKVLESVIFNKQSYQAAGKPYNKSKHAVYEALKRLYFKKYGRLYDSEKIIA